MFEQVLSSVISVDPMTESIGFYMMRDGDRNNTQFSATNYKVRPFDEEFFAKFEKIVKLYQEKYPQYPLQKAAIVLPDSLFFTDTVQIPSIHRRAMSNSLDLALGALYKNRADLKINTYPVLQNKQQSTFGLCGIRKEVLTMLQQACANCNVSIGGVTFAANAAANGAIIMNPKLKNGNFLMLDIKESNARFSFVVKGRTMGYYNLPFGYNMLYKTRFASEDMLFDHTAGELLVLNAKERAKAKQLTMSRDEDLEETENAAEEEQEQDQDQEQIQDREEEQDEENAFEMKEDESVTFETVETLGKKTARKLPKFMQRPTPQSREEYVFENFRLFMKWTLDILENNSGITSFGYPDMVYVNMPEEYNFLIEMANAEQEENGIAFAALLPEGTKRRIARNLDLFGGFYVQQYNKSNTF